MIGALLGGSLAAWWVERGREDAPQVAVEGRGGEQGRRPDPRGGDGEGPGQPSGEGVGGEATLLRPPQLSDTGSAAEAEPPLQEGDVVLISEAPGRVVELPDSAWPMLMVPSPVGWTGRITDLVATQGRLAWVHSDGKRRVVVSWSALHGAREVPGSEGGHSPFFVGPQLWWLKGNEVRHEGGEGPVVALVGPAALRDPAVFTGGFSLVVGDHAIEVFDGRGQGLARLDLPERLGAMAWREEEMVFTRHTPGDADLWSQVGGVLTPLADSPISEIRPTVDGGRLLWFAEAEPGSWDLVGDGEVLAERVLLPTRQGPSVRGGVVVVAAEVQGTLLLVGDETVEVVTGLDWVADPVFLADRVAFSGPGGLYVLGPVSTN